MNVYDTYNTLFCIITLILKVHPTDSMDVLLLNI